MIAWAIEALIASTLLMLVVLILRRPIAARFGAHAAYLLWLLPALRMMMPRLPQQAVPVPTMPINFDIGRLVAAAGTTPRPATISVIEPASATDWFVVAVIVWLAGAAAYLAWQLGRQHRFMALALGHARPGYRRGGVRVRLSPVVAGPLAAGLFHRHILLPSDFSSRYDGREQRLALAHELAHHRRGDLYANAAALCVLALHWFNPIAHWAYRAFRADQELACDATVLDRAPAAALPAYGRALIKSAQAGMPPASCALGPATELKRRMKMIAHSTRSRARRIIGIGLAAGLTVAGLGLTASGSIAAPSVIAPAAARPLFQAPPRAEPVILADRSTRLSSSAAQPGNAEAVQTLPRQSALRTPPPLPPLPPLPPAAARAPMPPQAPLPPLPPAPPAPPAPMSPDQIAMLQQMSQHASEEAKRALANIDVAAITRDAMAQARAELAGNCRNARPGPANEDDQQAITRLAAGCVDLAAINRQVQDALRQASEEIRKANDLTDAQRAQAMAAIDRAREHAGRRLTR